MLIVGRMGREGLCQRSHLKREGRDIKDNVCKGNRASFFSLIWSVGVSVGMTQQGKVHNKHQGRGVTAL